MRMIEVDMRDNNNRIAVLLVTKRIDCHSMQQSEYEQREEE